MDFCLPFILDRSSWRGRLVRLTQTTEQVLAAHDYPPVIANLLTECLALNVAIAYFLKFEGRFTLQSNGAGAVSMLVCDATLEGTVRGYARFDQQKLDKILVRNPNPSAAVLLGGGTLVLTAHQEAANKADGISYQGIVPLVGDTLADAVTHYFAQSEQIPAIVRVASNGNKVTALILQYIPQVANDNLHAVEHLQILLNTCGDAELQETAPEQLLYRLFHEEEIRLLPQRLIHKGCFCKPEKLQTVLQQFDKATLEELAEDGVITMTCEFCNTQHPIQLTTI